jgi:4-aminobutyrate aminotransferase / (S)-3-amino-2-methylpropionate transaminase / 5-aminovalerate transaminase
MPAALELFRAADELHVSERAERIGELFESASKDWKQRFPLIGDIRGVGAMRAIELVRDRSSKEPATGETKNLIHACQQRGLVILSAGTFGNVVRLLVPLTATDSQMKEGLGILEDCLADL